MEASPAQRPGSIRSVASNSSLASGVSLSRRPRTRTRSRTVTGSTERRPSETPAVPLVQSDLPYLGGPILQQPSRELPAASSQDPLTEPPTRPPRSSQRLDISEIRSSDTASTQIITDADSSFVESLPSGPISGKSASKAAKQASNLPLIDTGYKSPPSAFSRDPALTTLVNVRDSVSTQQSGVSSSLYPPSTSTASGPESPPSPRSSAGQMDVPPFTLEVNEVQEYDSDDVSYRLRLLVKNNYFLPPAHSKPSPEDLGSSPINPPKTPRSPAPFLNLFGIGRAKSKPTTPTIPNSGFDPMLPMLRTTSDSIAAPYTLRPDQPRTSSQFPRGSPGIPHGAPRGRVVVVREKVNDIAVAAKQAEQDLKARGAWVEQGSPKGNSVTVGDVIDPTDAVDVPLPSPSYPFAVQTSALHGLGVMESLGADVLAERLPPGQRAAPEDSWRKALLHQAVHHSLDNTPDISISSHALSVSTSPLASPKSMASNTSQAETPNITKHLIQQKIIAQPLADDDIASKHPGQKSGESTAKPQPNKHLVIPAVEAQDVSRPSSYVPHRVDTPLGPMTPLGPPPRRQLASSLFSATQDLVSDHQSSHLPSSIDDRDSRYSLRRTVSSPSLAEDYDASLRHSLMTPPPLPQYPRDSQATIVTLDTIERSGYDRIEGHTNEVDADDRSSLALSALNRPSLSEYSQSSMSPTTSTFQDMLNQQSHSPSSVHPGPSRFSVDQQNDYRASPITRSAAMSPPPRISSSLAHVALPPPPRSSSFNYQHPALRSRLVSSASSSLQSSHSPAANSEDSTFHIVAPEPTTPPLPASEPDPCISPSSSRSADISIERVLEGLQSTPGPSTNTSFFDSIQNQPNAMDDLDSSSEESDDEDFSSLPPSQAMAEPRSRAISNVSSPNPRSQIMRHGNFSAPFIRSPASQRQFPSPIENDAHSRKPIANIPTRPSKNPLPSSSFDFFKYTEENPLDISSLAGNSREPRRPSTVDNVNQWRNNQKAQESLRKLDGMLIQHMEVEKDTIKRIATHLKQGASSQTISSQLPH